MRKLSAKHAHLAFLLRSGPTGWRAHRQIVGLGHDCIVAAPSLIAQKPGDRVKTNRRDALSLRCWLRGRRSTPVAVLDTLA